MVVAEDKGNQMGQQGRDRGLEVRKVEEKGKGLEV